MDVITQRIFLDFSNVYVPEESVGMANEFFHAAIEKVKNSFIGTNVEIVLERPEVGEYSTLDITNISCEVADYLGIAEFDQSFNPSDNGEIRLDKIMEVALNDKLSAEHASNLMANTISHEIGHLMGLDHSDNPFDIMHNGFTQNMVFNPPSFSLEQIQAINTNAVIANLDNIVDNSVSLTNEIGDISFDITGFCEPDDIDLKFDDSDLDIDSII